MKVAVDIDKAQVAEYYRMMMLIRRFEEASARLYMQRLIRGFLHLYIEIILREAIAQGLREALEQDENVFILGEDIGEYDGAYAVTRGFLTDFGPERIRDTPISESGFVGAAVGAALVGMRPIVEIMTINFSLLAMDQIINHAAKLRYMSNGQLTVPMVIRTVTAARSLLRPTRRDFAERLVSPLGAGLKRKNPLATELTMPQMGYDMQEGTVVRWLKAEGSNVELGEPVAEIETDKAVVEFESYASGVCRRYWSQRDQQCRRMRLLPKEPSQAARVFATPVARQLAYDSGIDLAAVDGTGPGGRIVKEDVLRVIEADTETTPEPEPTPEPVAEVEVQPEAEPEVEPVVEVEAEPEPELVPLSRMRQQIARVTIRSKSEKPHFYVNTDVDMTEAMMLRAQINQAMAADGVRATVNDLIIAASVIALKRFPKFNAYYEEGGLRMNDEVNVGIAMAVEEGL
ncbi:Pyruvate dehydrogenase E1 component subunit beta, mitochondrial [Geodia barretti]|uniref:Dihydrolipoamide acetyltransferase component of pyruvate dehydrogenase complex n=1 Tax=Geodia barretti TaxID=519541 RepID=A0AA35SUI3_GEOBA|nr:Pyruvate dehydrogenase E1 component subunit beta, mitochondrial [Geodia barretti]